MAQNVAVRRHPEGLNRRPLTPPTFVESDAAG
jgi:hypothetical protein